MDTIIGLIVILTFFFGFRYVYKEVKLTKQDFSGNLEKEKQENDLKNFLLNFDTMLKDIKSIFKK